MKMEDLKRYFEKVKAGTNGDNSSNSDVIDFENGKCIDIYEFEQEYYKYKDLEELIDDYIEDEDLDSVSDEKQIKKHFANEISEDLFLYNQGLLKDFVDYMITKINNENKNIRKAKVIFSKNGDGYTTTKITLPVPFVKKLNVTEEDRDVFIEIKDNEIIIKKYL